MVPFFIFTPADIFAIVGAVFAFLLRCEEITFRTFGIRAQPHFVRASRQAAILADVFLRGPGTEEAILTRMEFRQRSDASSEISALVSRGHLVNLQDPRTKKGLKIRNTSGKRALVRGLPAHQDDRAIMDALLVLADSEPKKPAASVTLPTGPAVKAMRRVATMRRPVLGCKLCPVCKRRAS